MPLRRTFLPFACVILVLMATMTSCREADPIRIGFYGELTSRSAALATSGRNGFMLAIDQANAAGGIHGRRIEAIISDNHMDLGAARSSFKFLLAQKVVAVIGPMTSQMAVTTVSEANQARVPMISPTASSSELSGKDDFFLRVYYSNAQAAALLARHLAARQPPPRIVAVYDMSNSAYTDDWLQNFEKNHRQSGGQMIKAFSIGGLEAAPFADLADHILALDPEGILLLTTTEETIALARQFAQRNSRIPLYATGWSYTKDLLQFAEKGLEGMTIIQSANMENPRPEYQAFRKAYIERYGTPPNFPALHAYDATQILLATLSQDHTLAGDALRKALLELPPQPFALGKLSFDRYGDLHEPELHLSVIDKGTYRVLF